eukprot:SAG22_NODE_9290_length_598_cov_1.406814_1_plen_34_part_01
MLTDLGGKTEWLPGLVEVWAQNTLSQPVALYRDG